MEDVKIEGCKDLTDDFQFFCANNKINPEEQNKDKRNLFLIKAEEIRGSIVELKQKIFSFNDSIHGMSFEMDNHKKETILEDIQTEAISITKSIYLLEEEDTSKGTGWMFGKRKAETSLKHKENIILYLENKIEEITGLVKDIREVQNKQENLKFDLDDIRSMENEADSTDTDSLGSNEGFDFSDEDMYEDGFKEFITSKMDEETTEVLEEESMQFFSEFKEINERISLVAEKKIVQISELQNAVQRHIIEQDSKLQTLYDDSSNFIENVSSGNDKLAKGSERISWLSKSVGVFILFLAATILLAHFL
eukprot:GHVP01023300.1.p1 GENE.GHVP01023300.1~~GHVP01023300.1.p1  ORF type:complete len:308 (-),score=79.85 GHVP01023300.1:2202-3125(-)